jgi:hypothetical protein
MNYTQYKTILKQQPVWTVSNLTKPASLALFTESFHIIISYSGHFEIKDGVIK